MADKLLKSIKFPTLPDRYVIGDSTLTEEGAAADAKAVGDALATKADTKGTYEDLIVGGAEQLMADGYETDTDPYLFRPTGGSADVGNREYVDKIIGGTVAWNQLVSESATSVTVQSGHKYIAKIGGAWSVAASSGSAISVTGGSDMLIDLTALFNPTIADYIYSLEQSQAGAGVAWFRRYFPKDYYPYDPGTLRSVEGVSAHETVGFNQWDEEWEEGAISVLNGQNVAVANSIRSKNYSRCLGNTDYCIQSPNVQHYIMWYDGGKDFIGSSFAETTTQVATSPSDAQYFKIRADAYGTTYNHDICINLSDPTRNGEYEPYQKHTYPLDSSLTLRGVPKLVDGKLAFDGDVYEPDGVVSRRFRIDTYDGSEAWTKDSDISSGTIHRFYLQNDDIKKYADYAGRMLANKCETANNYASPYMASNFAVTGYSVTSGGGNWMYIFSKTIDTVEGIKAWLAEKPLQVLYELSTPTTETAEGYEQYQICDQSGTEEFVTDSIVPVGHETRYPHDLKKKIETAPDSPSTDGTYLMKRSGGKNSYMALPSTPSANGAYVLTLTVSGGNATYSWTKKE